MSLGFSCIVSKIVVSCSKEVSGRMLRVLLASGDKQLVRHMKRELQEEQQVETCCNSGEALDLLRAFDPDVLMLDAQLPGENIFAVIRTVRQSFHNVGIVVVSTLMDDCTTDRFYASGADYVVSRTCKANTLVSHILDVGAYVQGPEAWNPENETNSILLDLGFRMGLKYYRVARESVMAYYYSDENVQMKDIYYQVLKRCGGTSQQKEKALRDGIKNAVSRGDRDIWQVYFPPGRDGCWSCPTNEEFVARIATGLRKNGRMKRPYQKKKNMAI